MPSKMKQMEEAGKIRYPAVGKPLQVYLQGRPIWQPHIIYDEATGAYLPFIFETAEEAIQATLDDVVRLRNSEKNREHF